jgi:putative DNA primase/helicase
MSETAKLTEAIAAELLADDQTPEPLEAQFVDDCLRANERGDGVLYATMQRDRYLWNTTPKDGEWLRWGGRVWEKDDSRRSVAAVDQAALQYEWRAEELVEEIRAQGIDKDHADAWKIELAKQHKERAKRLRSKSGAEKALFWAPVVDESFCAREGDFDQQPMLLPCANGVINLETGALLDGRPADLLTRAIDVSYYPTAPCDDWVSFVEEVSGSQEMAGFIKRLFGYAISGRSKEQHIFCFLGPGRNGKGVLFDLIASVMGPYYHDISKAMLIEQRTEPGPNATSEHKYSLLGKRIICGAETNRRQKIDAGAVKDLTGENTITCRPLFRSEVSFRPTHTLFLQTNHLPTGLTSDFALVQRLLLIVFPFMYVDDPQIEGKKRPGLAGQFRKKDPNLRERLGTTAGKEGILRWLVEGSKEYEAVGLAIPQAVLDGVGALERENDYLGRFISECLVHSTDPGAKASVKEILTTLKWWWQLNMDERESAQPNPKWLARNLRERGYRVELDTATSYTYVWSVMVKYEVAIEAGNWQTSGGRR